MDSVNEVIGVSTFGYDLVSQKHAILYFGVIYFSLFKEVMVKKTPLTPLARTKAVEGVLKL